MNFLLLVVRLVLGLFSAEWRDSLMLAVRADGRIEHLPQRPTLWDRWIGRHGNQPPRRPSAFVAGGALGLRAGSVAPLAPLAPPDSGPPTDR